LRFNVDRYAPELFAPETAAPHVLKPLYELASDEGTQSVVVLRHMPVHHARFDPNRIRRLAKDDQQFIVVWSSDSPKGTAGPGYILTFHIHQVGVGWSPRAARVADPQPRFRVVALVSAAFQNGLIHGDTRQEGVGCTRKVLDTGARPANRVAETRNTNAAKEKRRRERNGGVRG
jgi:hypothetical protein